MTYRLLASCVLLLVVQACGNKGDPKYVGNWEGHSPVAPQLRELSLHDDGGVSYKETTDGGTPRVFSGTYVVKTDPDRVVITWTGDAPRQEGTSTLQRDPYTGRLDAKSLWVSFSRK